MSRATKLLASAVCLALLVLSLPWLVPLTRFVPMVEAQAGQRLGVPVKVGALRLYLLPLPHVTATDVTVGPTLIAQAARISVWPSLRELAAQRLAVREVRFEDVVVREEFLDRLAVLLGTRHAEGPAVRVDRIVLKRVELRLPAVTLRGIDGEIALSPEGRLQRISASTSGRRLAVTGQPTAGGALALDILATDWTPPAGPAIRYQRLTASAVVTKQGIETQDLRATLYQGQLTGSVNVRWKPVWAVTGDLAVSRVEVQQLAALLSREHPLTGRLTGAPRFATQARRASDLLPNLKLASDFTIEKGVLHKLDIAAVARNPLSPRPTAGSTQFDELSGHVDVDGDGYHFTRLRVSSGMLRATGGVSVARDWRLDGTIDAEVLGTGPLLSVPLQISGTAQNPSVAPTKTAMLGAIAGSALLPGVGTAIGIKASQLVDRMFAKRRPDPLTSQQPEAQRQQAAPDGRNPASR